jgi:hypothetical protein
MKKAIGVFCFCSVLFGALGAANATVPQLMPVQGVLADSLGNPIDGLTTMTFSIYDTSSAPSAFWTDVYTGGNAVDVQDGFFTVYLGELDPSGNPLVLDFDAPEQWLGITVGGDAEMPRIRLASVPFALESQMCRQFGALDATDADALSALIDDGCMDGFYFQGFDASGVPICAADETGAGGTLTAVNGAAPITASESGGVVTVGVNIGTTGSTVAVGNHTHTGTYMPMMTCTDGYVLKYNTTSSSWVCAAYDHGTLAGLGDDDHPQYFNLAQAEIVTGVPQFNGGDTSSSIPPFYVDSATWVQNLNCDLLDGYSSEDFAMAGDLPAHNHDLLYVNVTGDTMTGTLTMSTGASTAISATSSSTYAVSATSSASGGIAVFGDTTTGASNGVWGRSSGASNGAMGVYGNATNTTAVNYGVYGSTSSPNGSGVFGVSASNGGTGVYGTTSSTTGGSTGVMGSAAGASGSTYGVYGQTASTTGYGVYGTAYASSGTNYGVYGSTGSATGYAGYFNGRTRTGNLDVAGTMTISSNTLVNNLNADLLDGAHGSAYSLATHTHSTVTIVSSSANITAGNFGTSSQFCPIDHPIVVSCGIDVENVNYMFTTSLGPMIASTRALLTTDGTYTTTPNGCYAGARNTSPTSTYIFKLVTVCRE